jgi:hypothetical protein
MESKGI